MRTFTAEDGSSYLINGDYSDQLSLVDRHLISLIFILVLNFIIIMLNSVV